MKLYRGEGAKVVATAARSETWMRRWPRYRRRRRGHRRRARLAGRLGAEGSFRRRSSLRKVDILVHAAGVGYSWMEKSPGSKNDGREHSQTSGASHRYNLDACYLACRAVIPRMQAQAAERSSPSPAYPGSRACRRARYTAARAAMINLTRALRGLRQGTASVPIVCAGSLTRTDGGFG